MSKSETTTAGESERNVISVLRGSRPVRWMLFGGSRYAVAGVLLVAMSSCIFFALLALSPDVPYDRLSWLFNGLVNGLLSLITIILTINQLIVSRQFGSPKDLNDRLENRINFREQVEEETGSVISPAQPVGFVTVLFESLYGRAQELSHLGVSHDEKVQGVLDVFTDTIVEETSRVNERLNETQFEMAGLLTILNYDDSWQFYTSRRLQTVYGEDLTEDEDELITTIRELLRDIDTARQYFKTVYLQRELAQFSRSIVYTGIVAIVAASITLLTYDDGIRIPLDTMPTLVVVTILFALTLLPVAILFSYILRVATVARRTVVFGPFTPQEEQKEDSDWNL